MMPALHSAVRAFWDTIFPPRCHACSTFVGDGRPIHLCDTCLQQITFISSPRCPRCGIPFRTADGSDHRCADCMASPPPFIAARAPMAHGGPARHLIHLFKYQGKVQLRRPLGLLLAEHLRPLMDKESADLVLPVPLHPKKLRQRGYNQALLLGEVLATEFRIPLSRNNLRRVRWTEPQTELEAPRRAANVKGAFSVHHPEEVRGKRVLLVDDVFTTGSTVGECSATLVGEGAAAVLVATVVRALPD